MFLAYTFGTIFYIYINDRMAKGTKTSVSLENNNVTRI
jgi:hypothetical protein